MSDRLEQLIALSLKSGASDAEVYQFHSLSHPVTFQSNRLKQLESSQSEGIALRLWREGSPGVAVAYGEFDVTQLVEKAISLSHLTPLEEVELTEGRIEHYPFSGPEFSLQTLLEQGKKSIQIIREAYPDVICNANLEWEKENTRLVNSRGLDCEYSDYSLSYMLGVEWIRGDDFLGIYDGESTHHQIDTSPILKNILQRLEWAENNVTSPVGKVPILFTPNAVTMLWSTIVAALNAKYIVEGSSPWSERLKETVISEELTLWQDPKIDSYWCPFDDEGVPARKIELITKGRLQEFYSDLKRAKQLQLSSTGNGFRSSLSSYPTPDLVNLLIAPSQRNLNELIQSLDQAILVDQILGEEPDISGDFSVNIDLGFCIEKGEIIGRIKDTMIAGNVYTALNEVIALGGDSRWVGSCYTPSLVVDSLSVTS
jgi:PmbA protein